MELFSTVDTILDLNNEHSDLETEAENASLDPETYLFKLTMAAICALGTATEMLAADLKESTYMELELTSLQRSSERIQKCKGGYTLHDESSGNRSNVRPQPKRLWQEQKYRALKQILIAVLSRLVYPEVWADSSLPALQMSRLYIEKYVAGGLGLHQLILPSRPLKDKIGNIRETLTSGTMYLMELQDAGYSNREAEASYLRIYRKSFRDGERVDPESEGRISSTIQVVNAYAASEKLRDALGEFDLFRHRIQAMFEMGETEDWIPKCPSRGAYLMRFLRLAPSQDGNATNTAYLSTCASSAASSTS